MSAPRASRPKLDFRALTEAALAAFCTMPADDFTFAGLRPLPPEKSEALRAVLREGNDAALVYSREACHQHLPSSLIDPFWVKELLVQGNDAALVYSRGVCHKHNPSSLINPFWVSDNPLGTEANEPRGPRYIDESVPSKRRVGAAKRLVQLKRWRPYPFSRRGKSALRSLPQKQRAALKGRLPLLLVTAALSLAGPRRWRFRRQERRPDGRWHFWYHTYPVKRWLPDGSEATLSLFDLPLSLAVQALRSRSKNLFEQELSGSAGGIRGDALNRVRGELRDADGPADSDVPTPLDAVVASEAAETLAALERTPGLTQRERQLLGIISNQAAGGLPGLRRWGDRDFSLKAAAQAMGLRPATVRVHWRNLQLKAPALRRANAAI